MLWRCVFCSYFSQFSFCSHSTPLVFTSINAISCILTHEHPSLLLPSLPPSLSHTLSLRHFHTYTHRLCAARDMSLSMSSGAETDPRSNGEDESVGEMDVVLESTSSGDVVSSTKRHRNSSSKPPYQAFLGQLYALIEGAIDSNRCVCT